MHIVITGVKGSVGGKLAELLAAYTPEEVREQLDQADLGVLDVAMVSDRHLDIFGRLS